MAEGESSSMGASDGSALQIPQEFSVMDTEQLRSEIIDAETADLPEAGDVSPRDTFYAGLGALTEQERSDQIKVALQGLDTELQKIPTQDKSAYLRAIEECPKEAKAKRRRTAFLERERLDPKLAAERMVQYWEERLDLFGPDRCFLPMTLHGALKDEVQGILQYPINSVLPNKDAAGKTIIYSDPDLRDSSKYSQRSEAIALWYILETTFDDRRNGLVFVSSTMGNNSELSSSPSSSSSNVCSASSSRISSFASTMNNFEQASGTWSSSVSGRSFDDIFPLWFSRMHSCIVERIEDETQPLLPNYDYVFNKENQDRIKIHIGPLPDILQALEDHSLSREILPAAMGGSIGLNSQHWVHERLAKEYADAAKTMHARDRKNRKYIPSFSASSSVAANAIDPNWQQPVEVYGSYTYIPKPPSEALDVDESVLLQKTGRKADDRMNKAVLAKLRNPLLSRRDALMIGGYVYPDVDTGEKNNQIFDAEGVSLYQRMNHLNRRVKQMREKLEPHKPVRRNRKRTHFPKDKRKK